jgi:glutamate-5-semialdehyde dehydrogenase
MIMESIEDQLISAQNAKKSISTLSDKDKQSIITRIAQIISERKEDIIAENLKDLEKMSDTDPQKGSSSFKC